MSLYSALAHSVSNALGAPSTAEKLRFQQATEAGDAEVWIKQIVAQWVHTTGGFTVEKAEPAPVLFGRRTDAVTYGTPDI